MIVRLNIWEVTAKRDGQPEFKFMALSKGNSVESIREADPPYASYEIVRATWLGTAEARVLE